MYHTASNKYLGGDLWMRLVLSCEYTFRKKMIIVFALKALNQLSWIKAKWCIVWNAFTYFAKHCCKLEDFFRELGNVSFMKQRAIFKVAKGLFCIVLFQEQFQDLHFSIPKLLLSFPKLCLCIQQLHLQHSRGNGFQNAASFLRMHIL